MRRLVVGLLVGVVVGWAVAWWRLSRNRRPGLAEVGQEPMRIALPDLPWATETEEEVPAAEPVGDEAAETAPQVADEALARARDAAASTEPLLAYCARCRTKRPIENVEPAVTKDGRPAVRGTCPECGANMFRFVSW